ncbi:hypothetical protein PCASD_08040 [Puccinia coronata f. sp. avenae]|uniref:Uncharacterized protein n=2 Tax=Puccinia coronata f. sp. avenae TaxID=200324 RepID=A0A2N5UZK3_9BASI|nr:hypothetical protein PCASD_08040 [Puccinia coronata f. sp. avenae]
MKNYSAKSFLSFFICLVICIPHSSHSLSKTTSHPLHKRAASLVADVANAAKDGTDVVAGTLGGSRGLESTNWTKRPWFSSKSKPSAEERKELHLEQQLPKRTWKEALIHFYKGFKGALSKIRQKFRDFIRKEEVEFPYNSLFDQNPGLEELVKEDKSIDEKVDGFMKTIPKKNLAEGQAEQFELAHQVKVEKLKASLHRLHTIRVEDFKTLYPVWDAHSEISAKIRPMFLRWESHGDLKPMQVLGQRMAPYLSKFLDDNQKILSQKLPQDQKYLGSFFGKMGPKKVLQPWFQATIEEKVKSKELKLISGNGEQFLNYLVEIQDYLTDFAFWNQPSIYSNNLKGMEDRVNYYHDRIETHEEALVNMFAGGRDELKKSLEMIESMEFHQTFMRELKNPASSPYHYDLQFVEPIEYLFLEMKEEEIPLVYQKLEIQKKRR